MNKEELKYKNNFSLEKTKVDDCIAKYIVDNVEFLKYIHPNCITLLGIIVNIVILFLFVNKFYFKKLRRGDKYTEWLVVFLFYFRFTLDILDGEVARKYNKKSKIGGYMDTFSDVMLGFIIVYIIIKKFHLSKMWFLVSLIPFYSMYINDSLHDHEKIKNNDDDIFNKSMSFMINNVILVYTLVLLIILY